MSVAALLGSGLCARTFDMPATEAHKVDPDYRHSVTPLAILGKRDNLRLFTSSQIISNNIEWDRPNLRGHGVSYLADRSLSIDEVDDFIGIKLSLVLRAQKTVRSAA